MGSFDFKLQIDQHSVNPPLIKTLYEFQSVSSGEERCKLPRLLLLRSVAWLEVGFLAGRDVVFYDCCVSAVFVREQFFVVEITV